MLAIQALGFETNQTGPGSCCIKSILGPYVKLSNRESYCLTIGEKNER